MTLQTSGAISILDLRNEFGGAAPDSLSEYYAGGGLVPAGTTGINGAIPTSGAISLSQFYGASNIIPTGYFGGGYSSDPPGSTFTYYNEIDGITFSNDTAFNPTATLAIARYIAAGVNSTTKGYWAGGYSSNSDGSGAITYNEIDGIIFNTNTAFNPAATLSTSRSGNFDANSDTKGYFANGSVGSSEIDGIIFSNDTAFNPTATMPVARYQGASASSSTKGYWAGGYDGSVDPNDGKSNQVVSDIDAIVFSNDTSLNVTAVLADGARSQGAGVNSTTKGYFGGGQFSGLVNGTNTSNVIDGITFSNDTAFNPTATLAVARSSIAGVNSTTKGYWAGGLIYDGSTGTYTYYNEIDGITFSNDTAFNPTATLVIGRSGPSGLNSGAV